MYMKKAIQQLETLSSYFKKDVVDAFLTFQIYTTKVNCI